MAATGGISTTCLFSCNRDSILLKSLPQLVQKSGLYSLIKSGANLNSKVFPLWSSWPPDFLSDFSLKLLETRFISIDGGMELLLLFFPAFNTLISSLRATIVAKATSSFCLNRILIVIIPFLSSLQKNA